MVTGRVGGPSWVRRKDQLCAASSVTIIRRRDSWGLCWTQGHICGEFDPITAQRVLMLTRATTLVGKTIRRSRTLAGFIPDRASSASVQTETLPKSPEICASRLTGHSSGVHHAWLAHSQLRPLLLGGRSPPRINQFSVTLRSFATDTKYSLNSRSRAFGTRLTSLPAGKITYLTSILSRVPPKVLLTARHLLDVLDNDRREQRATRVNRLPSGLTDAELDRPSHPAALFPRNGCLRGTSRLLGRRFRYLTCSPSLLQCRQI